MSNENQTITENQAQLMGFIRVKPLSKLTGVSVASIWEWAKNDPAFPKPVKLSANCTAWRMEEVKAWMDSRERVQFKGVQNV